MYLILRSTLTLDKLETKKAMRLHEDFDLSMSNLDKTRSTGFPYGSMMCLFGLKVVTKLGHLDFTLVTSYQKV